MSTELEHQLLAGLLEAAADAIIAVDQDGKIVFANAQTERVFGYSRQELVGEVIEMLVPESSRKVHFWHRHSYFQRPEPRPMGVGMRLSAQRKDGSTFQAEISLGPLETSDGVLVSAAIRDVSERLEIEAERERLKTEAEVAERETLRERSERLESLGELAGGIAHDFNNLLSIISPYAELIAEAVTPESACARASDHEYWERVGSDVEKIQKAAASSADLVRQLLAFARRQVTTPRPLDVEGAVTDVAVLLSRSLGEHVELICNVAPGTRMILFDPTQMEQVLVNLAVNARDAMQSGGTLTIDAENVMGSMPNDDMVRLRVSDTGVGMSAGVLERAFEPFFTTKPVGQGTGLGLATTYGIVTTAGGRIEIESELGDGTTISIFLPVCETSAEAEGDLDADGSDLGGHGEVILLTEDDDRVREIAERILSRHGYEVLVASNGAEALALSREHAEETIEVLLTDVVMPKLLGRELLELIRKDRPDIRVLFMSGYAVSALGPANTLEEGTVLLEKPFGSTQLLTKVHDVLTSPGPHVHPSPIAVVETNR